MQPDVRGGDRDRRDDKYRLGQRLGPRESHPNLVRELSSSPSLFL